MSEIQIQTVYEKDRGCGRRKGGGFYLRTDGSGLSCGALPVVLSTCKCCGGGIKPARGMTYIQARLIQGPCKRNVKLVDEVVSRCDLCSFNVLPPDTQMGLIWIGTKFYPTPADFIRESEEMGISRRLPAFPRDFELGETWVALAHRNAKDTGEVDKEGKTIWEKHVFMVFKPERLEYVVRGDETEKRLKTLTKQGVTLVDVRPLEEEMDSFVKDETPRVGPGIMNYLKDTTDWYGDTVDISGTGGDFESYEDEDNPINWW